MAFQTLKDHLNYAILLSKSKAREALLMYFVISKEVIIYVFALEKGNQLFSICYMIKTNFLPSDTHYPNIEKFALSLVTSSKMLRHHFYGHKIHVLTNFPLKQVL